MSDGKNRIMIFGDDGSGRRIALQVKARPPDCPRVPQLAAAGYRTKVPSAMPAVPGATVDVALVGGSGTGK
jgi:hypothetical protein